MPAKAKATGVEAVVARAVEDGVAGQAMAAQPSLLPLPEVGLLGEAADGAPVAEASRRGGRPAGAKNRKTKEWVEYILRRYPSPLVALAETMSRPVGELARELGCTALEAFDRQIEAAKHLAPYLHQKLPTAIEVGTPEGIPLWLAVSPAMAAAVGEDGAVIGEDGRLRLEAVVEGAPGDDDGEDGR